MKFEALPLKGAWLISPDVFSDDRGWFARAYCKDDFKRIGHAKEWVQINHSFTEKKGTLRGMHFQNKPYSEIKLIRCILGAVFDVIVDIRKDSETFLKWYGTEISAANKKMIYVPEGFAHGFQALENNSELIYHHSEFYKKEAEAGLNFSDELLKISWPLPINNISERDKNHPFLTTTFKGI